MHWWGLLPLAVIWLTQPAFSDVIEDSRFHGNYRNLDTRLKNKYCTDKCDGNNHLNRAPDIRQERFLDDRYSVHLHSSDVTSGRYHRDARSTPDKRYIRQELRRVFERRIIRNNEDAPDIRRELARNAIRRNDVRRQSRLPIDDTRVHKSFKNNAQDTDSDVRRQFLDESRKMRTTDNDLLRARQISDRIANRRDRTNQDADQRPYRFTIEPVSRDTIAERRTNIDSRYVRSEVAMSRTILRKEVGDMRPLSNTNGRPELRQNSRNIESRKQIGARFIQTKRDTDADGSRRQKRALVQDNNEITANIDRRKSEKVIHGGVRDNNGIHYDTSFSKTVRSEDTIRETRARDLTAMRIERDISRYIQGSSTEPNDRRNGIMERRNVYPVSESNRRTQSQRHTSVRNTRFETESRNDQTLRYPAERAGSEDHARLSRPSTLNPLTRFQRSDIGVNPLRQSNRLRDTDRRSRSVVESRSELSHGPQSCSLNRRITESLDAVCSSERQFLLISPEYQEDKHIKSRLLRTSEHRSFATLTERDGTRPSRYTNSQHNDIRMSSSFNARSRSVVSLTESERDDTRQSRSVADITRRDDTRRSRTVNSQREDIRRSEVQSMSSRFVTDSRSIAPTTERDDIRRDRFINSERDAIRRNHKQLMSSKVNVRSRSDVSLSESERDDTRRSRSFADVTRRDDTRRSRTIRSQRDNSRRSEQESMSTRFATESRFIASTTERDDVRRNRFINSEGDATRRNRIELMSSRFNVRSRSDVSLPESELDDTRRSRSVADITRRDDSRRSRTIRSQRDNSRRSELESMSTRFATESRFMASTTEQDDIHRNRFINSEGDATRRNRIEMKSSRVDARSRSDVSLSESEGDDTLRSRSVADITRRDDIRRSRTIHSQRGDARRSEVESMSSRFSTEKRSITDRDDTRRSRNIKSERENTRSNRIELISSRVNARSRSVVSLTESERDDVRRCHTINSQRDDTRRSQIESNSRRLNHASRSLLSIPESVRYDTRRSQSIRSACDEKRNSQVTSRSSKFCAGTLSIEYTTERDNTLHGRSIDSEHDHTRRNQIEHLRRSLDRSRSLNIDRDDTRRNQEKARLISLDLRSASEITAMEGDGTLRRRSMELRDARRNERNDVKTHEMRMFETRSRTVHNEQDNTRRDSERQYYRTTVKRTDARSEYVTRLPMERKDVRINIYRSSSMSKFNIRTNAQFNAVNQIRRSSSMERDIRNRQKVDTSSAELKSTRRVFERQDFGLSTERNDRYLIKDNSEPSSRLDSSRGNNRIRDTERRVSERDETRSGSSIIRLNDRAPTRYATVRRDIVMNVARETTNERRPYTDLVRLEARANAAVAREDSRRNQDVKLSLSENEPEFRRNFDQNTRYSATFLDDRRIGKEARSVNERAIRRITREDNRRSNNELTRSDKEEQLKNRLSYEDKRTRLARTDGLACLRRISSDSEHGNRRSTERRMDNVKNSSRNRRMTVRAMKKSDVENRRVSTTRLSRTTDLRRSFDRRSSRYSDAVSSNLYRATLAYRHNVQKDSRSEMERQLNDPVLEDESIIAIKYITKEIENGHILKWQHMFCIMQAVYLLSVFFQTRGDTSHTLKSRSLRWWSRNQSIKVG